MSAVRLTYGTHAPDQLPLMDEGIVIWRDGDLTVRASIDNGDLVIYGSHRHPPHLAASEYEYWIRIKPHDVDALTAALGGGPGADVRQLLVTRAATLIAQGEKSWLQRNGVPHEMTTWTSD